MKEMDISNLNKNQHPSATQEKRGNPTQKKRENNNSSHNCLEIFLCQG
jgi:hypothetical protein